MVTEKAVEVRVGSDGTIRLRKAGEARFAKVSRTKLARDYAADHPVWQTLRSRGIQRPSPSGPTMPADKRQCASYALRLRPEEAQQLDALADRWGVSRSEAVVLLVKSARKKRPVQQRAAA